MNISLNHSEIQSASAIAKAPVEVEDVPQSAVAHELLRRAIDNRVVGQLSIVFPLAILAFAVSGMHKNELLFWLIGAQVVAQFLIAASSLWVKRVFQQGAPAFWAANVWTFCEALAGSVWAMMLLPITECLNCGMEAIVACVTVVVTLAGSSLMAATISRIVHGLLIGFSATIIPIMFTYPETFGPYATAALFLLIAGLMVPIAALRKQALDSLKAEMEVAILTKRLAQALDDAEYLSRHDALTGLLNRRDFDAVAAGYRQDNKDREMAVILLDLDDFKAINDNHGHAIGDAVLKATAAILESEIRTEDDSDWFEGATARWGGEEFVIALNNCDAQQAMIVAERIRVRLESHTDSDWPTGLAVSASFGVGAWRKGQRLYDAIAQADGALYAAKDAGRNCVRMEQLAT